MSELGQARLWVAPTVPKTGPETYLGVSKGLLGRQGLAVAHCVSTDADSNKSGKIVSLLLFFFFCLVFFIIVFTFYLFFFFNVLTVIPAILSFFLFFLIVFVCFFIFAFFSLFYVFALMFIF